ncbi:ankyrin repeat domain-containing protein [Sulfurimonas sp.]|uniref:ankyrin repeat domain-containing protein n=1 Tax=Sulfurimonas sp. TaxID=2022749 RepID=UPI002AAF6146|nr:ankyrin repeat domain-containing protein [Sulfurimonas sp.]
MDKWIEYLKDNDFISVKKFIRDGGNVNEMNESGESVLAYALQKRCDMDLLMLLIDNGADIDEFDDEGVSILDNAIAFNSIELVRYMIDKGIDVNRTNRRSRFTPLMGVACYGRAEIAELFLQKGVDKEAVDVKGFSAVDFARKMNKKSILKLLDYDESSAPNRAYAR